MIYNRTALLPLQKQRRSYLYTIFTADDLPFTNKSLSLPHEHERDKTTHP
ncbi:hypothetical protein TF3313_1056 [Tannerella forsythia 3313]|nr:hypothetical protein TF3313_1056 [Tannerella forsythia 3313]